MRVKHTIGCLVIAFSLFPGSNLSGQVVEEPAVEKPEQPGSGRFSVSGKGAYHSFWKQGVFKNGEEYGRPGLGVGDLVGFGGEVDIDFHWREYLVFTVTGGAYQGNSNVYNMSIITGYGLVTAKLQKSGELADYYVGAGIGGYFSRLKAEGTAYALKPGIHGLVGIRIHLNPVWSIILEDRLAFTMRAEEGFGDMDLAGNFLLLGSGYRF